MNKEKYLPLIGKKTDDKHPEDVAGYTPFAYAVKNGHLEVCEFIMESLENKNPGRNDGWTPLHKAAQCGHIRGYLYLLGWPS